MSTHYHFGNNLNKMDNKGFEREGTVELGAVMLHQEPQVVLTPGTGLNGNGRSSMGCSDHCLKLHQQHQLEHQLHLEKAAKKPAPESPWHHLKTIFLIGTIVFLAIWILVYTLLSQMNML